MISSSPILLIENEDVDAVEIERTLKDINVTNELVRKVNSETALEYLREEHNQKPCFVLLDMNLPRMEAFEFLKVVKTSDTLKEIPSIVLTTSEKDKDVAESSGLDVAGYIVKPIDYRQFIEAMRTLGIHWTLSGIEDEGE